MKGASKQQFRAMLGIWKISKQTGKTVDFDELIESLEPTPTKEAMQFVIRALIKKGFIEKTEPELRRKRTRVCFKLTEKGLLSLDPTLNNAGKKGVNQEGSGISFEEELEKDLKEIVESI